LVRHTVIVRVATLTVFFALGMTSPVIQRTWLCKDCFCWQNSERRSQIL